MNKKILIINGSGGCGKGEFVKSIKKQVEVMQTSIIDAVKEITGVNGKEEKDRLFLSTVKIAYEEYNDMPFQDMKTMVDDFHNEEYLKDVPILTIDMREPHDIQRAVEEFGAITIYLSNNRVPRIYSNIADAGVENYDYDYYIENDGSIEDLVQKAKDLLMELFCENKPSVDCLKIGCKHIDDDDGKLYCKRGE